MNKRGGPTMRDIATKANVHQTTVSLALRNHPSLPMRTRERIRRIAEELGYHPNPLLEAFNERRVAERPHKGPLAIAFVADELTKPMFGGTPYHPLVYSGARQAAEAAGYTIEVFTVGPNALSPARLDRILLTRGIYGVMLSTFQPTTAELGIDWPRYCGVKIDSYHLAPSLNTLSSEQWQLPRIAVRRLRDLGYRRIGLATAREDEARLGAPYETGLFVEQAGMSPGERVPPLLFSSTEAPSLPKRIESWIARHRIDAVISNWSRDLLFGRNVDPRQVAFASLDAKADDVEIAGTVQNHALVGARAVELLLVQMQTHRRGLPKIPIATYISGHWHHGTSAPPK